MIYLYLLGLCAKIYFELTVKEGKTLRKKVILVFSVFLALSFISGCHYSQSPEKSQLNNERDSSSLVSDNTLSVVSSSVPKEKDPADNKKDQSSSTVSAKKVVRASDYNNVTNRFFAWAGQRAKMGNMAVCKYFFEHGAAGMGDWYAITPDGNAQVQNLDKPGYDAFPIHIVGGVTFYYSKNGTVGTTDENLHNYCFADGFYGVARQDKPIVKYILGDNGTVYEYNSSGAYSDGFYEAGDSGEILDTGENKKFIISKDIAAQQEYASIIHSIK